MGYADGLNLYAYVGGNPTNFVDPMGLFRTSLGHEYGGTSGAVTIGGNVGPLGGFFSGGIGFDQTGDLAFDFSFGGGAELGSPIGLSVTGTADFLTVGSFRDSSGPGIELGASAFSPWLAGLEIADTFDGTVAGLFEGGIDRVGNRSRSRTFDFGAGTPGASIHLFQTFSISGGLNISSGEFFLCAGRCVTANPFE